MVECVGCTAALDYIGYSFFRTGNVSYCGSFSVIGRNEPETGRRKRREVRADFHSRLVAEYLLERIIILLEGIEGIEMLTYILRSETFFPRGPPFHELHVFLNLNVQHFSRNVLYALQIAEHLETHEFELPHIRNPDDRCAIIWYDIPSFVSLKSGILAILCTDVFQEPCPVIGIEKENHSVKVLVFVLGCAYIGDEFLYGIEERR